MARQGTAEPLPRSSKFLIYWHKPAEWADLVYTHIQDTGQLGSVVTVYEVFLADEAAHCEFHGLPEAFWGRVLKPLQKAGRAAVFGAADDAAPITSETGIKFI